MKNIKEIVKNVIHKNTTNADNPTFVGASIARPPSKARPNTKTILIIIPILILLIATLIAIGITNAAISTTEPETEQTFTEEGDGYYIWVRAVDYAGNKGPWSETQRVWIDTNPPIVTCTAENSTLTITEGDVVILADYFTIEPNGKNENITINCTIGSVTYTTTEGLTAINSPYTVTCTATKTGGNSSSETMTIVVESAGPASITTATNIQDDTTPFIDGTGKNTVIVPGGFKVVTSLATTVDKGIVIEDSSSNQFVWIPLGTITKADGSTVTVDLGRYTFDSEGTPTLQQAASNYIAETVIDTYYQELTTSRVGSSSTNATAINLDQFISKTTSNKGFYIARYEASSSSIGNSKSGVVATSKITQANASKAARAMYNGNAYVVSDLVNSYMWDTAIVFIQKCSDKKNYASQSDHKGTLYNTGKSSDVVCNIYDLRDNLWEWTTEYYPEAGVTRGGFYSNFFVSGYTTSKRSGTALDYSNIVCGFRVGLYVL